MATVELTKDNFEQVVTDNEIVFVDFWASWCGPCRAFAPVYETAAAENPDIVFGKVDTEAQPELAGAFQIMSIPTLMAFRDQIGLFAQPGALPQDAFNEVLAQVQGLDMDDVRRQMAEQHEAHADDVVPEPAG